MVHSTIGAMDGRAVHDFCHGHSSQFGQVLDAVHRPTLSEWKMTRYQRWRSPARLVLFRWRTVPIRVLLMLVSYGKTRVVRRPREITHIVGAARRDGRSLGRPSDGASAGAASTRPQLTHYRAIPRDPRLARVDILGLTYRDLHASRQYQQRHSLLVNDSLIISVMRRNRRPVLATNDTDFERVPGITVRTPAG